MIRLFCIFVVLLAVFVSKAQSACATTADKDAPKSFHVPIYFVTDRNRKAQNFGGKRKYLINCTHYPYYGECYPLVRNTLKEPLPPASEDLNWKGSKRKHEKVAQKTILSVKGAQQREHEFYDGLRKAVAASPRKELYVFVHGYCTPFELASEKAAELAYYSKQPAVLFSWPSVGKLFSYPADEANVEWSLEHFRMFFNNLERYHVTEAGKINLVAHSIGNRMVIWSGDELVRSNLIKQIVLCSPDVDTETFKHYALRYNEIADRIKVHGYILVSFKDDALPLSQMVHGGYFRLGEGIGSILNFATSPSEVLNIPGKLLETDEKEDKEDAAEALTDRPISTHQEIEMTVKAFKLIDFTAIDRGLIGHSIPTQLIVNLCNTGEPGAEFTLVPSTMVKRNFVASISKSAFKLLGASDERPQLIEKVIYAKDAPKKVSVTAP